MITCVITAGFKRPSKRGEENEERLSKEVNLRWKLTLRGFTSWSGLLDKGDQAETYKSQSRAYQTAYVHLNFQSTWNTFSDLWCAGAHVSVCVRACGIKVSCYSLRAPVGRTLRSSRRLPPSPWRRLIWVGGDRGRGEPDNAPRRKAFLLSWFKPDRCQFKRGESEGAGERAGERWSGAAGTEGGGERKERPRRAEDASAAPALLWLALAASPLSLSPLPSRWGSPVSRHVTKVNEGRGIYAWSG